MCDPIQSFQKSIDFDHEDEKFLYALSGVTNDFFYALYDKVSNSTGFSFNVTVQSLVAETGDFLNKTCYVRVSKWQEYDHNIYEPVLISLDHKNVLLK